MTTGLQTAAGRLQGYTPELMQGLIEDETPAKNKRRLKAVNIHTASGSQGGTLRRLERL
jgi:hypothetical protein